MLIFSTTETPIGSMTGCSTDDGICMLAFDGPGSPGKDLDFLEKHFKESPIQGRSLHLEALFSQLDLYFAGRLKEFSVRLLLPGTPFQSAVWTKLMNIPYGTTRSYLAQAAAMGRPGSVRAVANANSMNRIAIVVPCHRVIGADGSLTGYAGGLWRKKWLLEHEIKFSGRDLRLPLFENDTFINNK